MRDLARLSANGVAEQAAELQQLVADVLSKTKQRGATAAEVAVSMNSGLSVNVRSGDVETLERESDRGLGLTVYIGNRRAHAASGDLSTRAVEDVIDAAMSRVRFTAEDEFAGLADAEQMATDNPDLQLWHPWDIDAANAVEIALQAEQAAFDADSLVSNSDGASVNSNAQMRVYGNSHGFIGYSSGTSHSISCSVIAADEAGSMQRDYWYSYARDANKLQSATSVGQTAAQRTTSRLNARSVAPCKTPVIFAPELARSLLGAALRAAGGTAQYRRSSFLLDAAGQSIFADNISLQEVPRQLGGLASAAFDNEGVGTCDKQWVKDGVLQSYITSSYSARKLGLKNSGNAGGVFNLQLLWDNGNSRLPTRDELFKQMHSGLFVTEMMGQGVNPVTGDYSRGAAGFWIENGEIAYPVQEITVAGNLKQMYRDIVAVGADIDERSNVQCGSMLIDGLTVAGAG